MKRNFFEDGEEVKYGLNYKDGFRFGFGMFIGWSLGLLLLSGVGYLIFFLSKVGQ